MGIITPINPSLYDTFERPQFRSAHIFGLFTGNFQCQGITAKEGERVYVSSKSMFIFTVKIGVLRPNYYPIFEFNKKYRRINFLPKRFTLFS